MLKAIFLVLVCTFMIVAGQVLWKIAIDKNGGLINRDFTFHHNVINLISSPYMLSGIFLYVLATVFWMYLLGRYEYSYIYPMFSMSYIISFFFAAFVFNETITIDKIIGVILIIAGVFFVARGGPN